ncbi:MAG: NlpC/P60 family protein [Patescibacteria group bacterium]
MFFYGVGNRCAVPADFWGVRPYRSDRSEDRNHLSILDALLRKTGFRIVETSVDREARGCLGARYELRAGLDDSPPKAFDCSSLAAHVYGRIGIRIPRISIDQLFEAPGTILAPGTYVAGDLVFTGRGGHRSDDDETRIRHVGIATGEETIIHACKKRGYVVEDDERSFFEPRTFRAVRRILSDKRETVTIESIDGCEIRDSHVVRRALETLRDRSALR